MKKLIFICFLLFSIATFSKDINIGDLISINIKGVPKEEIYKAFENPSFQLEEVKENDNGYTVMFRPYFVGEKTLIIGNQKLNVVTKTLLKGDEKNIFHNLSDKSDTKLFNIEFPFSIVIFGILSLVSLVYLVANLLKFKKEKQFSPDEVFNNKLNSLTDDNWAFELSMAIREYIDSKFKTHYINGFYSLVGNITEDDVNFLTYLDTYKFSGDDKDIKAECIKKVKILYSKVRGENNGI